MTFPITYRESNECCWVEDAQGVKLLQSAWFTQTRLGSLNPDPVDDSKDATARETLKELVRLANIFVAGECEKP